MLVSVVICTYTMARLDDLDEAMISLLQQTYRPIEIIVVVDNNKELYETLHLNFKYGIRVVHNEHIKGLSGSKNIGINSAQGEIIAFLDDDAIAAPDWIEQMVQVYEDKQVVAVGGLTLPQWIGRKPIWFPEELFWVLGCTYKGHPEEMTVVRNVFGGNCSFRRSCIHQVGEFLPYLGRIGNRMLTGEETEYCMRIWHRLPEHKIMYNPAAVIQHKVPESRTTLSYLLKRTYGSGFSLAVIHRLLPNYGLKTETGFLKHLILSFVPRMLRVFPRHPLTALGQLAVVVLGVLFTGLGYLVGSVQKVSSEMEAETGKTKLDLLENDGLLSVLASFCSLLAWVMLFCNLVFMPDLRLGPFGLIHSLSPPYFVAIVVSLISGFLTAGGKQEKPVLQFLNYGFLLVALWLVPIILEGTPRFASTYKTMGFVEYVYRSGRLNPADWELFYHNWPGFSLLSAALWIATGLESIYPAALLYPAFLHSLMAMVIYWMLRQPAQDIGFPNAWYLAGAFYLIANFVNQDYFSPQSVGYFLLSLITVLLVDRKRWLCDQDRIYGYKITLLILFAALAMTHILSSLVALALFIVFNRFDKKTYFNLVLFSIVVLVSWTIYGAVTYFDAHIANIVQDVFRLGRVWSANINHRIRGSPEHVLVGQIRIAYAACLGLCGVVGWLFYTKTDIRKIGTKFIKKRFSLKQKALLCSVDKSRQLLFLDFLKVSIANLGVAGALVYGGESFMRAYLLMLVPLAFACISFVEPKKRLIWLLLFYILALPFHFIAHYGNELVDYVSPGIIRGTDFLAQHSSGGYVVGHDQILGNPQHTEKFISLTWARYLTDQATWFNKDYHVYLSLGPWERNYWWLFQNNPDFVEQMEVKLKKDRNSALFYSNKEIDLYIVYP